MTAFAVRLEAPAGGADLLGLWAASAEPVSFAAPGSGPAEAIPVWSVDLAADPAQAAQTLEAAQRQVAAAEAALGEAAARLASLAERESGAVSFAAEALPPAFGAEGERWAPERAALDDLAALRQARGEVSFGPEAAQSAAAQAEAERGFAAVVERLVTALSFYAVVETRLAGRLAARTAIAWSGDAHTVWPAGPAADQLALHARSLRLTLASRAALTRTFFVAAQGAAKLAAALALPGVGALAALPIAWKFINQVLAAARPANA